MEVGRLYRAVKKKQDAFKEDKTTVGRRVFPLYAHLPASITDQFSYAMHDILKEETCFKPLEAPEFERMSAKEFVEYRNLLLAKQYFFANEAKLIELLDEGLKRALVGIAQQLPSMEAPSPFRSCTRSLTRASSSLASSLRSLRMSMSIPAYSRPSPVSLPRTSAPFRALISMIGPPNPGSRMPEIVRFRSTSS